jgi:hypothetical protein
MPPRKPKQQPTANDKKFTKKVEQTRKGIVQVAYDSDQRVKELKKEAKANPQKLIKPSEADYAPYTAVKPIIARSKQAERVRGNPKINDYRVWGSQVENPADVAAAGRGKKPGYNKRAPVLTAQADLIDSPARMVRSQYDYYVQPNEVQKQMDKEQKTRTTRQAVSSGVKQVKQAEVAAGQKRVTQTLNNQARKRKVEEISTPPVLPTNKQLFYDSVKEATKGRRKK